MVKGKGGGDGGEEMVKGKGGGGMEEGMEEE